MQAPIFPALINPQTDAYERKTAYNFYPYGHLDPVNGALSTAVIHPKRRRKLQEKYKINIQIINFGGGFGIPYFEGEKELDIKNLGFGLKKLIEKYKSYFSGTKFLVESGRYLVGECGNYVTKVLYKKKSKGKIFLIIDGGFNHVLLPSFNNGALFKKNFKISVLKDRDEDEKEVVTIAGPLCTPYDILAKDMELPIIKSGDLICIHNVGAYGYSYSPLEFLSHKKPKEIIKQL